MLVDSDSTIAEEEEQEEAPVPASLSINLIEPEKIQHRRSNFAIPSPPTVPWSMVAIRDYEDDNNHRMIIFPPIDHENLQISTNLPPISKEFPQIHRKSSITSSPYTEENSEYDSYPDSDSNSSATFSPSDSSAVSASPLLVSPTAKSATDVALWFDSWVEILRSKLNYTMNLIWRNFVSMRRVSLTFQLAGMLLVFLYFWRRRRFTTQGNTADQQLLRVIRERDEKISQLLDQIAALNRAVIAFHRVPSSSST